MLLSRKEIQKIAATILKEAAVGPAVQIRANVDRTIMGGKGGGASVSLRPGVSNELGSQPPAPGAPSTGEGNGKSLSKA